MRAAFALAVSLVMQTVIMGAYLLLREPGQMTAIFRHWRPSLLVGIAGFLASVGWFTAFTLQNAAYVRAVGQIELIFTFIASVTRSEEHTSELQSLMRISYAVFCLKKKKHYHYSNTYTE